MKLLAFFGGVELGRHTSTHTRTKGTTQIEFDLIYGQQMCRDYVYFMRTSACTLLATYLS